MKKYAVAFMLVLMAFLTACSNTGAGQESGDSDYSERYPVSTYGTDDEELNTLSDVELSWKTEELDLTSAAVVLENLSDKDYQYSSFEVEAEQDGVWYQLDRHSEPAEDERPIPAHERTEAELNLSECYGTLSQGHYRLILPVTYYSSSRNWEYDTYYLSCEFTIGQHAKP